MWLEGQDGYIFLHKYSNHTIFPLPCRGPRGQVPDEPGSAGVHGAHPLGPRVLRRQTHTGELRHTLENFFFIEVKIYLLTEVPFLHGKACAT